MMDEPTEKNINAQLAALGSFVESFELMVDEVRYTCIERICHALGSVVENDTVVEVPFHHQVMTAKPLYDIMRAIVAEIVSKPSHFHFQNREQIKSLLGFIENEYNNLYYKRNELLHGTWYIGYANQSNPLSQEFLVRKLKTTSEGLRSAKELPKNAEELSKLAQRCRTVAEWIGNVDYCIRDSIAVSEHFKCEVMKKRAIWYFRRFPSHDGGWTTLP